MKMNRRFFLRASRWPAALHARAYPKPELKLRLPGWGQALSPRLRHYCPDALRRLSRRIRIGTRRSQPAADDDRGEPM